jgi:hypothetical protein
MQHGFIQACAVQERLGVQKLTPYVSFTLMTAIN